MKFQGAHYAAHTWLVVMLAMLLLPLKGWAQTGFDEYFMRSPAPMWMVAVDDGDILRANPAAVAFYGYADLEQMNIDQINTFTSEQVREDITRASRQERNHLVVRHRLADDSIKVVGIYSQPYSLDGENVMLSSIYDMSIGDSATERRYIETVEEQVDLQTAELRRARARARWFWIGGALAQGLVIVLLALALWRLRNTQRENVRLIDELSFRNQELERLSQAMAHHFQEPSRRLVCFAHQLQRGPEKDADSATALAVHFIGTQSQRLSDLVGDVQRYLGVDAIVPSWERVDVERLIAELYQHEPVLADMRESASLRIEGNLPDACFNHKQLTLLFKLLLHNALQYRHPERPLKVVISATVKRGRAYYRVADNGQGIAPEYRQQVFEMFTRLVPNGESYPGTGVGLATVVKMLRKVKGRITVEDGMEGGASLVFDLPLAREKS
ncbi:sensor histidine kinase [Vreelandella sp. EE22]